MRCFDTATIFTKAGDGGNGCVAFRREKFVAKGINTQASTLRMATQGTNTVSLVLNSQCSAGGPSGGNGGLGGHVWAVVDPALNSLRPFRRQVHFRAKDGANGGGSQMNGAAGEDVLVRVPPGTLVRRKGADEGEPPLAELLRPGRANAFLVFLENPLLQVVHANTLH